MHIHLLKYRQPIWFWGEKDCYYHNIFYSHSFHHSAPYTTLPILLQYNAPLHMRQGSTVTYKVASGKYLLLKKLKAVVNSHDLCMSRTVVQQFNLVVGTGNDAVVHNNDGTNRHFILIKCFLGFCKWPAAYIVHPSYYSIYYLSANLYVMDNLMQMRNYFDSGITKPYAFRKEQLKKLRDAVKKYEQQLHEALYTDLKKSPEECWVTETGFLLSEISNTLKHLKSWMEPERVSTNLLNLPSKSFIMQEPLGVVLIISPWNYPFQLLITPLVGAMAAGNCVVLKASEFAPATAAVMKQMIEETFDKQYIQFVEGDGATVIPEMMNNFTFDHVFYTGSTAVGKIIYKMAAERLVPVTLELGGKSPCVVEADANIKVAAKRIAMTKFSAMPGKCV